MGVIAQTIGYNEPMHYLLSFWSHDGATHISNGIDFDSTASNPTLKIHDCRLRLNTILHELTFEVDNSAGDVPTNCFEPGNIVYMSVWKNSSFKETVNSWPFTGYIDFPSEDRYGYQGHKFRVRAYEMRQAIYDSNVTFVKNAPADALDNPTSNNAKKFEMWRLVKDLLTNKEYTLLNEDTVAERLVNFDVDSGISKDVNIIFPRPRIRNQSAGVGIDEWAELIGFNWYLKYPNGNPRLMLKYPNQEYVPIVMKTGETKDINVDIAEKTSYITDPIQKISSSSQEGNVASVLSAISKISNLTLDSNTVNTTSTAMNFKAIAQPFHTNETNFTELVLTMSKFGEPESPKNRVNGSIFIAIDGKPGAKVLDFQIPLSSIEEFPTNITVDLTAVKILAEAGGFTDFFIVVYQRSGKKGDPNNDTEHGVRWHRDNSTDGGSLIAQEGDREKYATLVWKPHGPKYVFAIRSSINRLFVATNQELVAKIGKKEPPSLDFSFIEDINTAQRYLSFILYYASLYKVPIPLTVTVPNDFLFEPYQIIGNVFDSRIFPDNIDLEIQEVEYDFARNTNECTINTVALIDRNFPRTFGCTNIV